MKATEKLPNEPSDIDHEIKSIQLQRERLALEREKALHGAATAAGSVAAGAFTPFKALARFFVRRSKPIILIATLAGVCGGAVLWKQERDRERLEAAIADNRKTWEAGTDAFVGGRCPTERFQCDEAPLTACLSKAKDIFERSTCVNRLSCSGVKMDRIACESDAKLAYIEELRASNERIMSGSR